MRCPKCRFISFDDLSSCAKCTYDLSVISIELQGSCTDTTAGFYLASVIQTPDMADEDSFSDSQILPPISHDHINFDETHTGKIPAPFAGADDSLIMSMDDSMEIGSDDDVSIELGEIMPIDLSQLDSTQILGNSDLDDTESISFDDGELELDLTDSFGVEPDAVDESVGLDLSTTPDLDDTGLDLDLDDETPVELGDVDLDNIIDDTDIDLDDDAGSANLELENLALVDTSLDLENKLDEIDDGEATGEIAILDEDSVEDLTGEFPVLETEDDDLEIGDELVAELSTADRSEIEDTDIEIEDLTGEFPSLEVNGDASGHFAVADAPALSLDDIDVSDLLDDSTGIEVEFDSPDENFDEEVDLSSLMDSAPSDLDLEASDDLDLDMLDDQDFGSENAGGGASGAPRFQVEAANDSEDKDIPEIELLMDEEEEDDGPPDLPA